MPQIVFTAHLAQVGPRDGLTVPGETVAQALDAAFALYPRLGGYILDDQRRLRPHIAIFVDGLRLPQAAALQKPIMPDTEVYVLQALSGG
jgi:hypothetical protein